MLGESVWCALMKRHVIILQVDPVWPVSRERGFNYAQCVRGALAAVLSSRMKSKTFSTNTKVVDPKATQSFLDRGIGYANTCSKVPW